MKTVEGQPLLWSMVSEKRCEEQKTQQRDLKSCMGVRSLVQNGFEGLVMESFQSKSGVCPPTDIHGQNQQGLWEIQRRARELVKGLENVLEGAAQGAGVV